MSEGAAADEITRDSLLGGQLQVLQPRRGHRAGTDAVLLAASLPAGLSGRLVDVGAGTGAAGLAAAVKRPGVTLDLIEMDPALAALAGENLGLNNLAGRGRIGVADILDAASRRDAGLAGGCAGAVITNPPFYDPARSRPSPRAGKSTAHVMPVAGTAPLEAWIAACLHLLAEAGLFVIIHRPDALATILRACSGPLGGLTLLAVHPQHDRPASRILLRGKKGSRAPLAIARPLILHAGESFTPEAAAIHRGETFIEW